MPVHNFAGSATLNADDNRAIYAGNCYLQRLIMFNPSDGVAYVKFVDHATVYDVSAAAPEKVIGIPTLGYVDVPLFNERYTLGIMIAAATESGAGETDPSVSLVGFLHYTTG